MCKVQRWREITWITAATCLQLVSSQEYLGCFVDKEPTRDLNEVEVRLKHLTVYNCVFQCQNSGFPYAGLQYGSWCFCGYTYGSHGNASEGECNVNCYGDIKQICGGKLRNSVYAVGVDKGPTADVQPRNDKSPPPFIRPDYLGCFKRDKAIDFEEIGETTSRNLTIGSCIAHCAESNYAFAALEAGRFCYCRPSYFSPPPQVEDKFCNFLCIGNAQEFCGGNAVQSVYYTGDAVCGTTTENATCLFPFYYNGVAQFRCTTDGWHAPWCSTTRDFDVDKQFATCLTGCPGRGERECYSDAGDQHCVFPFIYKGKSYNKCLRLKHHQPWCSTTSNYDVDKKWVGCPSWCPGGAFEYEGCVTVKNVSCRFPFTYQGATYTECTTTGYDRPWCVTSVNERTGDLIWDVCSTNCARAQHHNCTTVSSVQCIFPFTYEGKFFDKCSYFFHQEPWCPTTENYQRDGTWGVCRPYCPIKTEGYVTTDGRVCAFPFTYKGETYNECITVNSTRAWCSVTSNYDFAPDWDYCA